MFHFSRFDPQVHPGLTEIEDELTQHPNRLYRIGLSDYAFSKEDLESLLEKNCGMVVLQSDQLEAADLDQFIEKGQSSVLIRSKDFEEQALLRFLEKGAEVAVGKADGFDLLQMAKLIEQGKQHTLIEGTDLTERQLKKMIESGATVILRKGDLSPFAITRLAQIEDAKMIIHAGGFSDFRIKKLLEAVVVVHFGEETLLSQPAIKDYLLQFPNQIQISEAHFSFDLDWVEEMEQLGALVV